MEIKEFIGNLLSVIFKQQCEFNLFNPCFTCGCYIISTSGLCEACEKNIYKKCTASHILNSKQDIKFLFNWNDQTDYVQKIILSLKGPFKETQWKWWARYFYSKLEPDELFSTYNNTRKKIYFISAPSNSLRNHSYFFANELAKLTNGIPCNPPLKKLNVFPQFRGSKKMNKTERYSQKRFVKMTNSSFDKEGLFIFCDDVRTTGATCEAIYESLGRPRYFQHWVLAVKD